MVAPDILSLTIDAQWTVLSTMTKYEPQPGDEKKLEKWGDGTVKQATLLRNGKRLGRLQGKNLDWFFTDERLEGDPLLEFVAETPANYTIQSSDDPNYSAATKPVAVYRKSVPRDVVLPGGQHPTRHQIYLKLPSAVQTGKTYSVKVAVVNVKNDVTFKADLQKVRSEAVHVNQIGYRPDDPVKRAFLSVWLGTGGAYTFPEGLSFSLIEEQTGKSVLSGKVERILAADGTEQLWTKPPKNYSSTAIYRMDFSAYNVPGTYRVYVDGIGCSYPFQIGRSVWEKAFLTQMKGLYKQRSGIEVGPPYTDFKKPRDFHPDDGAVVTRSKYDVYAKGPQAYADIVKGDTGEVVKDAWGGYHDAGDWNPRRVTHMSTTLAQLELCELYPDYFNKLKLNIPPMPVDGVPDMINEALFEIDCFRRLQLPDGAVPHGIETDGDPGSGEVSWLSTQHCYVLAPNIRDTWLYGAVAGRAAKVLKPLKPEVAQIYLDSAVRAFKWAEGELAKKRAAGEALERKDYWDAFDARNLCSLVLYDITGDKAYHEVFLQDTCLKQPGSEIVGWGWNIQCDQVFLYARMDAAKTDPKLRENARAGVISLAERSLKYAAGNAFNITQREPGRPMFAGFFSTPGGSELVRAHYLTGKPEYLKGAVQSCQFPAGCNPNNLVYTSGLGANPVKVPLELDARSSGQPVPAGLTVFGNTDYFNNPNSFWDINLRYVNRPELLWPDAYSWPLTEAYFDVWVLVSANEYVIDTWAPNVLVWGYLSARPDQPR
jgi:endoglucanase